MRDAGRSDSEVSATGGSVELHFKMLQGVTVQFLTTGGSGELQGKMLEGEVVSVPATGGSGQRQCKGSRKDLQCYLPPLEAVLTYSARPCMVWFCSLSPPLETVMNYNTRC